MQVEQLPEETLLIQFVYIKEIVEIVRQSNSAYSYVLFHRDDLTYTILKTDEKNEKQRECIALSAAKH